MQNKKPMLLVFAGPNGSGKSTITHFFEIAGEYTNADDIVRTTGMSNEDAAVFADEKRYACIAQKRDFTFETVLSSKYKMALLREAKESGYFIKCVFVLTADPQINVNRVAARYEKGGHYVQPDKVVARYRKSLDNIKELLQMCDIMHVYDNTKSPRRIIRKHKDSLTIYPDNIWTEDMIRKLIG